MCFGDRLLVAKTHFKWVLYQVVCYWCYNTNSCLFYQSSENGKFDVVGSLQPILAAPGDDVILPCHVEPKFNVARLTVEWSRPDRRPDPNDRLSRVEYVHLYRDAREVPDMKIPSYFGRTALFTDGLREGNISLRITNVTQEDEGRYRCFIPKLNSQTTSSIVHLIVEAGYTLDRSPVCRRANTQGQTHSLAHSHLVAIWII
uniref:Ig-like domain-containing protein n=1 Tax=Neolamprologus brichardi TaxID=32507 RepID=A0A3Q4GDA6_NEOBR